jgi:hypothetical protein
MGHFLTLEASHGGTWHDIWRRLLSLPRLIQASLSPMVLEADNHTGLMSLESIDSHRHSELVGTKPRLFGGGASCAPQPFFSN